MRICVYCGSRSSQNPLFLKAARTLGTGIAQKGWGVVYGGGKIGMMGLVADSALTNNGEVIGVIPTALKTKEVAHTGVTKLIETPNMHSRKAKMEELSDAFLVLPGGFGTLDEFFEILTWRQLGFHHKPIVVVNIDGYFNGLSEFVNRAVEEDYIRASNLGLFRWTTSIEETFDFLELEFS
ncbi:MAG: TIGR00730 family Rossman fold protein [Bacteroidota bacterium]